jgi:hypothetical protein
MIFTERNMEASPSQYNTNTIGEICQNMQYLQQQSVKALVFVSGSFEVRSKICQIILFVSFYYLTQCTYIQLDIHI